MSGALDKKALIGKVKSALKEDLGKGDITSAAVVRPEKEGKAVIRAKAEGVLAGLPAAEQAFLLVDSDVSFHPLLSDGDAFSPGQTVARMAGRARSLLAAERTALNFLQHLSGIATLTSRFVKKCRPFSVAVVDTRKTVPGLRELEKYAVRTGGGTNHRMGLYDQVLLKENHFQCSHHQGAPDAYLGTIQEAKQKAAKGVRIIVESKTFEEALQAAEAGADIVMLDNMALDEMTRTVEEIRKRFGAKKPLIEASGGINMETVEKVAACGVDRISMGAVTMAAPPVDLAMYLE